MVKRGMPGARSESRDSRSKLVSMGSFTYSTTNRWLLSFSLLATAMLRKGEIVARIMKKIQAAKPDPRSESPVVRYPNAHGQVHDRARGILLRLRILDTAILRAPLLSSLVPSVLCPFSNGGVYRALRLIVDIGWGSLELGGLLLSWLSLVDCPKLFFDGKSPERAPSGCPHLERPSLNVPKTSSEMLFRCPLNAAQ